MNEHLMIVWRRALAAACLVAAPGALALTPAAADPVNGLIVQMRDAHTHVALARERALGGARGGLQAREAARWQALARHLGSDAALARDLPLVARAVRRDPVGASAQVLRFERALSVAEAERIGARLASHPDVAWVASNTRERRQGTAGNAPNDPYFGGGASGQWWLQPVQGSNGNALADRWRGVPGFLSAWITRDNGSSAAVVAVLDTGTTAHPELAGRLLPGYDFVDDCGYANDGDCTGASGSRDADPSDPGDWVDATDRARDPGRFGTCEIEPSTWHGTVIAGMLAATTDNAAGVAAMNWNGRVVPVRVAGKCGAEVADIVEGMRWAAGLAVAGAPVNPNPARIVNISFGGSAECNSAYQSAIDDMRNAPGGGAVLVAAAGNGHGALSRPASCERVIGVVALNRDGFKTNYSNFGTRAVIATVGGDDVDPEARWNALADSGILSVGNAGSSGPGAAGYFSHFGTSFSTPVAAGVASLMLSVHPALTADQIIQGLRVSARPHVTSPVPGVAACSSANPGRCLCTVSTCGAGILDAPQALAYAAAPGTYVAPAQTPAVIDTPELRAAAALGPDRAGNPPPPPATGGGSGGGAMTGWWLVALSAAVAALSRRRRG
jgi:serine protease